LKRINVAIIGCGAVAEIFHIPTLLRMPEFNISYLVDVNEDRIKVLKNKFQLKCKIDTDYRNVLKDDDLEAVLVLTPPKSHSEIVVAAAENGKHVFCEKPFAINAAEGEKMVDVCKRSKVKLMVGFQNRFFPQFQKMKELVDKKFFGKLIGGHFTHFANAFKWPTVTGFQYKRSEGGGALFEMGCHFVDLAYWFLGYPESVKARILTVNEKSPVDDTASVFLEFENGITGIINVGWNELSVNFVTLFGTDAYAFTSAGRKGEILYFGKDFFVQSPLRIKAEGKRKASPYHDELLHFYECIAKNKEPMVTGKDGLNVTKIIEKAYLSSELGKSVSMRD
jgi:predicted dehydrogenase